jgi:hypothetical protein
MADEGTETATESTNGVSRSSESLADARSAFLAMTGGEEPAESKSEAKPPARDVADDDSDLDEGDDADEVEASASEDDDSDLDADEDEEKDEEEKPDDEKADPDTSKRLAAVQRTEKRMREQLRKDRAAMEAELEAKAKDYESRVRAEIDKWAPRIEAAERFEKAAARVNSDPEGVLRALGLKPERYEHAAQVLYTLAKGKDDPKAAAAAAQLMREREREDKLEGMEKRLAEREEQDKKAREASEERERAAAADRELDTYFGKVAKATTEKTPLASAYIKANPTEARERMQVLAFRIAKEAGSNTLPKERDIVIALEKDRRRVLRELGIDPKSRGAAQASAQATDSKAKAGAKKPAKPAAKSDSAKPFTKEDFINGKFD